VYFFEHYSPAHAAEWDAFAKESKNGSFLFTRNYREYHSNHVIDCSIMVRDTQSGRLVEVLPASLGGKKIASPSGLIIGTKLNTHSYIEIFNQLCDHLRQLGLRKLVLETAPAIYHTVPSEEDRHALFLTRGQLYRRDILSAMDLRLMATLPRLHDHSMKKEQSAELSVRLSDDYGSYWDLLEASLRDRNEAKPAHSLEDMRLLAERFPENIQLIGCFNGNAIMAGIVLYRTPMVIRAQYIADSPQGREVGALDFLFASMAQFTRGEHWFDFGISNEVGSALNSDLIKFQDDVGNGTAVRDVYHIDLEACRPDTPRFTLGDAEIVGELPNDRPIKLTISIITYNQRHLLPTLLDDIMGQVGNMDGIEVLIGDDGSRDGTQEFLREFVAKWPGKARAILSRRKAGTCAISNRNHLAARGDYVALMAGDDRVLPRKFAVQMAFLDAHPDIGLCYHDVEVVYLNSERKSWRFSERHKMRSGDAATVIRYGSFFSPQSSMLRRELVQKAYMRTDLDFSGDTVFFAEMLEQSGSRIDFVPDVYLKQIMHRDSGTATAAKEVLDENQREMAMLRSIFPQYTAEVDLRQSDYYFILTFRAIIAGQGKAAFSYLIKSIRLAGAKWSAPWIAFEDVRFRVRRWMPAF